MGIVDEPLGERAEPLGMHLKPLGHRHPQDDRRAPAAEPVGFSLGVRIANRAVESPVGGQFPARDVPSSFQSLEHLLWYCARPPFALERLSVTRGPDGRIARFRYVLPRHKAANWVGSGHSRLAHRLGRTRAGALSTGQSFKRRIDDLPVIDIHSL